MIEGAIPEGAMIVRRTTVTTYLDPETGEPESALSADTGSDDEDQVLDLGAHLGDLQVGSFTLWELSRG